jgi:hypothetical protein
MGVWTPGNYENYLQKKGNYTPAYQVPKADYWEMKEYYRIIAKYYPVLPVLIFFNR